MNTTTTTTTTAAALDERIPLWVEGELPLTPDNGYTQAVYGVWTAEYAVHVENVVEVDGDVDIDGLGEEGGPLRRLAAGLALIHPETGRQGNNVDVVAETTSTMDPSIDEEFLVELFVTSKWGMSSRVLLADIPAAHVGITPAGKVAMLPYPPAGTNEQVDRPLVILTGGGWERLTLFIIPPSSRLADQIREAAFGRWMANAAYAAFASLAGDARA